jgi:ferredoxin
MIQQIAFLFTLLVFGFFISRRIRQIRHTILLGKPVTHQGPASQRLRNMLLVAFGQKKMFTRFIPAFFHLIIYVGFLVINLEVLEFVIDGLAGTHRIFAPVLGSFYTVLMNIFELLAAGVLVACVVFLVRRNILKLPRFWSAEMTAWPRLDANIILIAEIVLMLAILKMNAADQILQQRDAGYTPTGKLLISSLFVPLLENYSTSFLVFTERFAWWFHIVGILAFAVYITYSKHLHIFMAFPNTYYARTTPAGQLTNMPVVTREVKSMLGIDTTAPVSAQEPGRFGAKDVNDLPRTSLMAAYACTECGRCTSECPANLTGKKLSPRKIMMDVRDRLEEVGRNSKKGGTGLDDGKTLLDHYITREEINACTSCNACVEACPVLINPLDIIIELRRYVAMEESGAPPSWNAMFQNLETNFAPWKFPAADRFNWAKEN